MRPRGRASLNLAGDTREGVGASWGTLGRVLGSSHHSQSVARGGSIAGPHVRLLLTGSCLIKGSALA